MFSWIPLNGNQVSNHNQRKIALLLNDAAMNSIMWATLKHTHTHLRDSTSSGVAVHENENQRPKSRLHAVCYVCLFVLITYHLPRVLASAPIFYYLPSLPQKIIKTVKVHNIVLVERVVQAIECTCGARNGRLICANSKIAFYFSTTFQISGYTTHTQ